MPEGEARSSRVSQPVLAVCLAGVVVSLLLVGVVSGTVLRHIVQVLPAAIVLTVAVRGRSWAGDAALPVFLFWLAIMMLIWLFLMGVSRVVTGVFTPAEVVLTVTIGASSIAGLAASARRRTGAGVPTRMLTVVLFAALQVAAMWASLQPSIATR
jgi:hypothetical protein